MKDSVNRGGSIETIASDQAVRRRHEIRRLLFVLRGFRWRAQSHAGRPQVKRRLIKIVLHEIVGAAIDEQLGRCLVAVLNGGVQWGPVVAYLDAPWSKRIFTISACPAKLAQKSAVRFWLSL